MATVRIALPQEEGNRRPIEGLAQDSPYRAAPTWLGWQRRIQPATRSPRWLLFGSTGGSDSQAEVLEAESSWADKGQ
jgi:hypothetical protein